MKSPHVTELLQRSTAAKRSWPALSMLTAAVLASFSMSSSAADLENPIASGAKPADRIDRGGVIYAMTNAADGNEILVFGRDRKGGLHAFTQATVSTGGLGGSVTAAVDPLGSQHSLVYDADSAMLFAVNAGDNTVTAMATDPVGLPRVTARVPSGGFIPVSIAVSGHLVYVLNAGGTGAIATFTMDEHGGLSQIGSLDLDLPLQATAPPFDQVPAPGQVGVDALERHLIVTHAGGQELLVAVLDDDGIPMSSPVSTPTPGAGTFSFGVTRYGTILVAEAASASVSAFDPPAGANHPLIATASAVGNGQAATCWILVHDNGFAFVANTASNTLSQYRYSRTGQLELEQAVAANTGAAPTDLTFANGGKFIYSLDAGSGEISGFAVDLQTGELTPAERQGGLPAAAGIQGIASHDF